VSAAKSLPPRPSLESLRKQAKTIARDRAVPLREAQRLLARDYGYAGWQDLTAEVRTRLGGDLERAAAEAERIIHDNDVERLGQLLAKYPALLSWQREGADESGGVLGFATGSYGDSFDASREQHFTRAACAELLIDAGAIVTPAVCEGILASRARGLLQLFQRKGVLPRTLKFLAALGDIEVVHKALAEEGHDPAAVTGAFTVACSFQHEAIASLLLDRAIALDPELGARVDESIGRPAFAQYFIANGPGRASVVGLWKAFVMEHVTRAVYSWRGSERSFKDRRGRSDLPEFLRLLHREPWLLAEPFVEFQTSLIERATLVGRVEFITALLELNPALLSRRPPPLSQALEFAFTYANTHVVPILTRIWPLPDDLPHAAGMGDIARVKGWFDASGAPALGDVAHHYPSSAYMPKGRVEEYASQWGPMSEQRVLDVALAWAVINSHFEVADFLLGHGANINTTWSSHEPASILHELVWHRNYEAMQFLIDRGIDMTIRDYRWHATARGWAEYAAEDPALARWLEEAERQRG
jgi:hypothetical protein